MPRARHCSERVLDGVDVAGQITERKGVRLRACTWPLRASCEVVGHTCRNEMQGCTHQDVPTLRCDHASSADVEGAWLQMARWKEQIGRECRWNAASVLKCAAVYDVTHQEDTAVS